jgi:hypothetical protein
MNKIISCSCYNLLWCRGNWQKFIDKIAKYRANYTRIFLLWTWQDGWKFTPFQVIGFIYGNPYFDLSKWNVKYWEKFLKIINYIKNRLESIYIVLHCYPSLKKSGWQKYLHPFVNSIQADRLPGGVWGERMKKWHLRYFTRVIHELQRLKANFYIEVMNEYDAKDWDDDYMVSWHQWAVNEIMTLGVPKEKIIASSMRNPKEIASQIGIYSVHGIVRPEKIPPQFDIAPNHKILISGDGGFDGRGRTDWKGRRGASINQMREIGKKIMKYNYVGYEYFDRGIEGKKAIKNKKLIANVDLFDPKPLKAIAEILNPKPEPKPIPPEPEPIPKEWGKSRWQKLLERIKKILCWIWKFLFGK